MLSIIHCNVHLRRIHHHKVVKLHCTTCQAIISRDVFINNVFINEWAVHFSGLKFNHFQLYFSSLAGFSESISPYKLHYRLTAGEIQNLT